MSKETVVRYDVTLPKAHHRKHVIACSTTFTSGDTKRLTITPTQAAQLLDSGFSVELVDPKKLTGDEAKSQEKRIKAAKPEEKDSDG